MDKWEVHAAIHAGDALTSEADPFMADESAGED
jgi:hypothetical protein